MDNELIHLDKVLTILELIQNEDGCAFQLVAVVDK